MHVRPKQYGPPFLLIGPELSNVDSSNFAVNLGGRVTFFDWLGRGSETRLDLGVGTRQRPASSSTSRSADAASSWRRAPTSLATPATGTSTNDSRPSTASSGPAAASTSATTRAPRRGAPRLRGRRRARPHPGRQPLPARGRGHEQSATLQFTFDGQNSPVVPSRGLYSRARCATSTCADVVAERSASSRVRRTSGRARSQGSWFKRMRSGEDRVFIRYGVGTSFGDQPLVDDFSLGGPLRLGAFNNDELRGPNYLLGTVGYLKGSAGCRTCSAAASPRRLVRAGQRSPDWDDTTYQQRLGGRRPRDAARARSSAARASTSTAATASTSRSGRSSGSASMGVPAVFARPSPMPSACPLRHAARRFVHARQAVGRARAVLARTAAVDGDRDVRAGAQQRRRRHRGDADRPADDAHRRAVDGPGDLPRPTCW